MQKWDVGVYVHVYVCVCVRRIETETAFVSVTDSFLRDDNKVGSETLAVFHVYWWCHFVSTRAH